MPITADQPEIKHRDEQLHDRAKIMAIVQVWTPWILDRLNQNVDADMTNHSYTSVSFRASSRVDGNHLPSNTPKLRTLFMAGRLQMQEVFPVQQRTDVEAMTIIGNTLHERGYGNVNISSQMLFYRNPSDIWEMTDVWHISVVLPWTSHANSSVDVDTP